MKAFIYLAVVTLVILLQTCQYPVASQEIEYANRKWLQVNRTLYQINVEPETKWKEALVKCGKEKLKLLKPSATDSNYMELQNFIKTKFKQFPSFWTQNNASGGTLMETIGFKKGGKGKSCNKLDHKTFQIKAEECHQPLGYICQTTLVTDQLKYKISNTQYFIDPEAKYSCAEASSVCALRNMTTVFLDSFQRNKLLNDYLFLQYGSKPSFWFSTIEGNINTGCFPWNRISRIAKGSQHGVICETTVLKAGLTFRHLVLIGSVSVMLVLSLIVFGALKCFFIRKRTELHQQFHNEKE